MNILQHYKKEGSLYIFKNQPVFVSILVLFFLVIIVMAYKWNLVWLSVGLLVLVVMMIINFFAKKFIIDTHAQTITGKHSIFVPAKTYSIQDFTNFHVFATKYMGFITINVMLSIHFDVDGKEKKLTIGQAVSHKGIQKMLNETEDIMNGNRLAHERN